MKQSEARAKADYSLAVLDGGNEDQMRVLVCGGRDYSDRRRLYAVLSAAHEATPFNLVLAGGASGADSLAADWCGMVGVPLIIFHADWELHGRAAGPKRNQRMLDEGKPDLVLAFPGGRGTEDMVRRAWKSGVKVTRAF